MNCPKCNTELVRKFYKGSIETDACPNCRGMWLDTPELDRLEDMAFDDDPHKGSLMHFGSKTNYPCPHCGAELDEFQYRLYDLKLDYCAGNGHGFWLDAGEDERVMDFMRQRAANMQRKVDADSAWQQILRSLHSLLKNGK